MKTVKKAANRIKEVSTLALGTLLSSQVWAEEVDPLGLGLRNSRPDAKLE